MEIDNLKVKTYIEDEYKLAYAKARKELGHNLVIIEKKEVKEIEAPKVETITKDDFFAKIKENTSEKISNIEKSNPFENIDTNNTNEVDIFSAVSVKPPKPQIVKGATGTIIGNNNNKSSGTASNRV